MFNPLKSALVAVTGGFVNGLFGAGGGTLFVPALERFLGFETHKAHATTVAVILPLSVVSALIYLRGLQPDWTVLAFISTGGVIGGFMGAKLLNRFTSDGLHKIFGAFMIAAAIRMIL